MNRDICECNVGAFCPRHDEQDEPRDPALCECGRPAAAETDGLCSKCWKVACVAYDEAMLAYDETVAS